MNQSTNVPSPFLRLYSMIGFSVLAWVIHYARTRQSDVRGAMRVGMALGFVLSGVDHFITTETRYVPMLPDAMKPWGKELVYFTGVTELLGAAGLLTPLALYRRLGLPNLRPAAGVGITLMLAGLMVANANVAIKASEGHSFGFDAALYWLRLVFQLVFIFWALYSSEAILPKREPARM